MSAEKILADWKKKHFKAVYWLEGGEEYYIDMLLRGTSCSAGIRSCLQPYDLLWP